MPDITLIHRVSEKLPLGVEVIRTVHRLCVSFRARLGYERTFVITAPSSLISGASEGTGPWWKRDGVVIKIVLDDDLPYDTMYFEGTYTRPAGKMTS